MYICNSSHPQGRCPAYGKVSYICKKNTISNFAVVLIKCIWNWKRRIRWTPDQNDYGFFIGAVNIHNSARINQIKNENFDWSITLPSNGISVSYKIDTGDQCNAIPLTILKKFDPEPDLYLVNIKLSAYNNSKILVLGKYSITTLKHKKDHFDVSFIVVDSISVPILGLATSKSLNLIKCISAVNEQFLSEFSDCFGETPT